jgi:hypothetical protein
LLIQLLDRADRARQAASRQAGMTLMSAMIAVRNDFRAMADAPPDGEIEEAEVPPPPPPERPPNAETIMLREYQALLDRLVDHSINGIAVPAIDGIGAPAMDGNAVPTMNGNAAPTMNANAVPAPETSRDGQLRQLPDGAAGRNRQRGGG